VRGSAGRIDKEQSGGEDEQQSDGDGGIVGAGGCGAGVDPDEGEHGEVGDGSDQGADAESAMQGGCDLADDRHEKQRCDEWSQIARCNGENQSGDAGGGIGYPGDLGEVVFPCERGSGDHKGAENGSSNSAGQDTESEGQFPEHGNEDESRSGAPHHAGEPFLRGHADGRHKPQESVDDGDGDDGRARQSG
jgi:hypothetical protein